MSDNNDNGGQEAGLHQDDAETAEAQRLAARRRFLKGGAVALPLIVSVSRETFAHDDDDDDVRKVGRSVCASIGVKKKSRKNTDHSALCRIRDS